MRSTSAFSIIFGKESCSLTECHWTSATFFSNESETNDTASKSFLRKNMVYVFFGFFASCWSIPRTRLRIYLPTPLSDHNRASIPIFNNIPFLILLLLLQEKAGMRYYNLLPPSVYTLVLHLYYSLSHYSRTSIL